MLRIDLNSYGGVTVETETGEAVPHVLRIEVTDDGRLLGYLPVTWSKSSEGLSNGVLRSADVLRRHGFTVSFEKSK